MEEKSSTEVVNETLCSSLEYFSSSWVSYEGYQGGKSETQKGGEKKRESEVENLLGQCGQSLLVILHSGGHFLLQSFSLIKLALKELSMKMKKR